MFTKSDGTLWVMGFSYWGGLGLNTQGTSARYSSPVQLPGTTWNTISGGYYASVGTKTDGTLWTWGWNRKGVLGQNQASDNTPADGDNYDNSYSSPVQVPGTSWISAAINGSTIMALKSTD